MGTLQFLREHVVATIAIVVSALLFVVGVLGNAYDVYQLGLPGWAWQIAAFFLFMAVVVTLLARMNQGATPQAAAADAPHIAEQGRQRGVLDDMTSTALRIDDALDGSDEGYMRDVLPDLKATLLSLSKTYGVEAPILPNGTPLRRRLEVGARYLTDVGAMLRQGHITEARESAADLVILLNQYVTGAQETP